ncbi:MAG: hypothetical protein DRJ42_08720 [Deltaproteobacteria bacterium]|nr:MAG: hypothetical protein DRJ42_08720 [Deltaproteobacteria bacterium]
MNRLGSSFLVGAFLVPLCLGACDGDGAATDGGAADAADAVPPSDAAVADAYCPVVDYAACGGDLTGTWAFRSLCPDDPAAAAALCEHPYDDRAECVGAGNEAVCDGTHTGTLTFNADGTVDIDTTVTLVGTWSFTDACLAAAVTTGTTPEERCANFGNGRATCTYEGSCTCVGDPIVEADTNTATYAVVGDELTIGDDPPASYCIAGDLLTMDYYVFHPVSWRYWVLERQ